MGIMERYGHLEALQMGSWRLQRPPRRGTVAVCSSAGDHVRQGDNGLSRRTSVRDSAEPTQSGAPQFCQHVHRLAQFHEDILNTHLRPEYVS